MSGTIRPFKGELREDPIRLGNRSEDVKKYPRMSETSFTLESESKEAQS